jgi:hypothetical protein
VPVPFGHTQRPGEGLGEPPGFVVETHGDRRARSRGTREVPDPEVSCLRRPADGEASSLEIADASRVVAQDDAAELPVLRFEEAEDFRYGLRIPDQDERVRPAIDGDAPASGEDRFDDRSHLLGGPVFHPVDLDPPLCDGRGNEAGDGEAHRRGHCEDDPPRHAQRIGATAPLRNARLPRDPGAVS